MTASSPSIKKVLLARKWSYASSVTEKMDGKGIGSLEDVFTLRNGIGVYNRMSDHRQGRYHLGT